MTIIKAAIRGFRCFDRYDIELDKHCTVIAGPNASGKTSLLEAFHVASRIRSFRTASTTDLIKEGAQAFSVRLFTQDHEIHVAYGADTHVAEINGAGPATRSILMNTVSLLTITEQDLLLVQGGPEGRRMFLDHASIAHQGGVAEKHLKKYYQIHRQRTALLNDPMRWNRASYEIITEQAWEATAYIRSTRQAVMLLLQEKINALLQDMSLNMSCQLRYQATGVGMDANQWCRNREQEERRMKRSLMGAHLDDMEILLMQKPVRRFASRGMQKLITIIMKVAQALLLPQGGTLLLDDVLADFDEEHSRKIMELLVKTNLQLVFTVPLITSAQDDLPVLRYPFPASALWICLQPF